MSVSGKFRTLFSPRSWRNNILWSKQRLTRGWSDKDTWDGGGYIMEVCAGILEYLNSEKGHVDWEAYFEHNYDDSYGYRDLNEVANDLNLYMYWQTERYSDEKYSNEEYWAINYQLYSQAKNAMHFVAENIGNIWD